ncbi:emp24/gp25L/p24 family/GOLD-domain-containing protein [Stachybotrys elegans]|uniref:Emp24/gp25L/p24 family/GOLD-domain-containing protein n=1 Tax=Stachybotrys elegans TaxID=80388 RepID=A0A8K0SYX7_9HYPO|nr:emp24/gp25L/p24 family/GOLD-domain-containing protein [Stachybotrys elegans]
MHFLGAAVRSFLAAAVAFQAVAAHNIVLPAHGVECFHENLRRDDRMTVTFQVGDREFGSAGNLDIDFWIARQDGEFETNQKSVANGDFTFTAKRDDKYTYCFSNQHWNAHTKEVSFNVHGVVYVDEGDVPTDPLEAEVRRLSELLDQVKDEQAYIVIRERTHRNTAESTNSRVKWWNLFVIGLVIGESLFQVWWLRRFFEVKRVL